MEKTNLQNCLHAEEVAAYLDGELAAASENAFERHLTECAGCANKLNAQKRLLCALGFAFEDERNFELPKNFVQSVVVRAEAEVSGLRSKDERRRALLITGGIFMSGVAVGFAGRKSGLLPVIVDSFLSRIMVVFKVLADFCYDFGIGLSVILRVTGRQFITNSPFALCLLTILLVAAFIALWHLLFNFHRTQQSG